MLSQFENSKPLKAEDPQEERSLIIGQSHAIESIRRLIGQVADKDVNVLITGESGTGKEVVAKSLHDHSGRFNFPFVAVNCGAIPAELIESELFGHEKGAFTGAITARKGRFELAKGGTLFLDEIGDLPFAMQIKLLRVLQEKVFERVGGSQSIKAQVRIIAATNKNLEEETRCERFREDLYYRLNVFPIELPPLRQRKEDIPLLVNYFIDKCEKELKTSLVLSDSVMSSLIQYPWTGNVRELSNLIERLMVLYPDQTIERSQIPERYRGDCQIEDPKSCGHEDLPSLNPQLMSFHEGFDLKQVLGQIEVSYIQNALSQTNGVVAHAATLLGIRRTTLVEKLKKYQLIKSNESNK